MNPVILTVYDQTKAQFELSKAAFESILAQDIPVEVYVINNGSTCPETLAWLDDLAENDQCALVRQPVNTSPIRLHNTWLDRIFRIEGCEHILSVPDDVLLPRNLYRKMLEWPQGIVAANMSGPNPPPAMEEVVRIHGDVHMSVPLLRKSAYESLIERDGYYLDDGFFMYGSDCDLKMRIVDAGIPTAQLDLLCWHYGGGSHRLAPGADQVHRQADADRGYFARKWGFAIGSPEYDARMIKISEDR